MREYHVDDPVRLLVDVPSLRVTKGSAGVIDEVLSVTSGAYAVRFDDTGRRVVLGAQEMVPLTETEAP